jgi:hypothetical protein
LLNGLLPLLLQRGDQHRCPPGVTRSLLLQPLLLLLLLLLWRRQL